VGGTGITKRNFGGRGRWALRGVWIAAFASAISATLVVTNALGSAPSRPINYCQAIGPYVRVWPNMWGFHAGHIITGPTGTYTRGHGHANLVTHRTSGIICQVNRPRHAPDREIVLAIGRYFDFSSHYAVRWGVPGNIIKLNVRVKRSTDPTCRVGTLGHVTIFASYNGVHRDSVQFNFPNGCKRHRRLYTGSDVVTNVPPNR
jgi:hypothetical protein